jgi:hypothetical protein
MISSCYQIQTEVLVKDDSELSASSMPILLSSLDHGSPEFYFLLTKQFKNGIEEYKVNVRWKSTNSAGNFDDKNTTLKFLVNNLDIIDLKQSRKPVFIGFDLNSEQSEFECSFDITRQELEQLSRSKRVIVELRGKIIATAKFNGFGTRRAFKDFINKV